MDECRWCRVSFRPIRRTMVHPDLCFDCDIAYNAKLEAQRLWLHGIKINEEKQDEEKNEL